MMRMAMNRWLKFILSVFIAMTACHAAELRQQELFGAGHDGYFSYRIPSLLVTKRGALLAFCEGRKNSRNDTGDIDLLVKRSVDGGRTWSPAQVVADRGADTVGNPCPVVDRPSGTIWVALT